MKKIILLFLAFTMTSLCYSQDSQEYKEIDESEEFQGKKFYFGVVGGYNQSKIRKMQTSRAKGGFYTGLMLETFVERNLSVQVELTYTQLGVRIKQQTTFFEERQDDKIHLDYLAFSVISKVYIEQFNVQWGILFGTALNREIESNGSKRSLREEVKSYTGGFLVGAGYQVTNNLSCNIRGYFSDTISKEEELEDGSNRRIFYNLSFGLSLRF